MGWFSNYYRTPRTTQELREFHGSKVDQREEEEYDIPAVRAKRRHIPTAWDDRPRGDKYDRSWKRHRKTQWKPKKLPKKKNTSKFRGYREVSARYSWRGKQRFSKKRVWSWKWSHIGHRWDPNEPTGHWEVYKDETGKTQMKYRRKYGACVTVYGWKWVGLTPTVTITNGYKVTRYPELKKSDNGVSYFTGEWIEKVKKLAS